MSAVEFTIKEVDLINFKKRKYVRTIVTNCLKRGELVKPDKCELCACDDSNLQAHHVDYGKPLDIKWVCSLCHGMAHRKDHPLNPKNNRQTPLPSICDKYQYVTISFNIPVKSYLALKEDSENQNKPISKLVREITLRKYPANTEQLEFNFGEKYDDAQQDKDQRIQSLAEDEIVLLQSERTILQEIWGQGSNNLPRVERELSTLFEGYGTYAGGIQRNYSARRD